ncbi:MAG: NAD(P)/FAD-dependent oxidoreductase [Clostridia bacterium]|nr:NAD(P)/FAD-dependent oxidoreductase [Clostridia bacterium]
MKLIATNLNMPFNADESTLRLLISADTRLPAESIRDIKLVRRSLDARDKNDIRFIYSATFEVDDKDYNKYGGRFAKTVSKAPEKPSVAETAGDIPQPSPVVVVGAGPAGLFAAHTLAVRGYDVIMIDRGKPIEERRRDVDTFWNGGLLDTDSNIMFGEGGAGAFSDGKLTTRIKDARAELVAETLVKYGAPERIAVDAKPHVGTDVLRVVVSNIRKGIEAAGGKVRFGTKLTDITAEDGRITAVTVNGVEKIPCCAVVLALGQAARDTYRMLFDRGVEITAKPFAVGVRIEHPQPFIDRSQFGKWAGHPRLGSAEYRLTAKSGSRGVYTFCMCPGGFVVASSSNKGEVVTNGMSYAARDAQNANSGIIVQVNPSDLGGSPFCGVEFQERIERAAFRLGGGDYSAPAERVADFLSGSEPAPFGAVKPTYRPQAVPRDLKKCLPGAIHRGIAEGITAFARQIKGFDMGDAVLTAVESRTSSPVRIMRDENGEATRLKGLYPVGEGAGYAGGIVSAAVDGMRAAERIIAVYKPERTV